jgi:formylglycine-generating enzyme required for sulfatase activity
MDARLFRPAYSQLSETEREAILREISSSHQNFKLLRFAHFQRYGQSTDTAVYDYNGTEFVFVPGDTVTLGWDSFASNLPASSVDALQEELEVESTEEVINFFRSQMSPVRTVTVSPLLVERRPKAPGWIEYAADSPEVTQIRENMSPHLILRSGPDVTYAGYLRERTVGGTQIVELYQAMDYEGLIAALGNTGFRLPTEDEWEYLCGGGSRSLYRWGESLLPEVSGRFRIPAESQNIDIADEHYLAGANQFGVAINFDPYKMEVVMDSPVILKGGDGGCAMCGGASRVVAFLSYATYSREGSGMDAMMRREVTGDYTISRRVLRLT